MKDAHSRPARTLCEPPAELANLTGRTTANDKPPTGDTDDSEQT